MKSLMSKMFMILLTMALMITLISSAVGLYVRFAYENEYDITYLEDIDSTCVKHLYHGYAVMDCFEGNHVELLKP